MPTVEVMFEDLEIGGEGARKQREKEGLLLRNGTEAFRKWQLQSAMGHWAVMRTVLPREVWEDW